MINRLIVTTSRPHMLMIYKKSQHIKCWMFWEIINTKCVGCWKEHQLCCEKSWAAQQYQLDIRSMEDAHLGFEELRELRSNGTIRISVSGKGGIARGYVAIFGSRNKRTPFAEFIGLPRRQCKWALVSHLMLSKCDWGGRHLNHIWITLGVSAQIDRKLLSRLNPTCQMFRSLLKTHKLVSLEALLGGIFKTRLVMSCVCEPPYGMS